MLVHTTSSVPLALLVLVLNGLNLGICLRLKGKRGAARPRGQRQLVGAPQPWGQHQPGWGSLFGAPKPRRWRQPDGAGQPAPGTCHAALSSVVCHTADEVVTPVAEP